MGIPLYFKTITKRFPEIIINLNKNEKQITHLFLDFNGLIHPCVHNVLKQQPTKINNEKELYDLFFQKIKKELFILLDKTKPTELLYIAIDGVAPRAKMSQQRKRRFRSVWEKRKINEFKKHYNQPSIVNWDTNAITPGTKFMKQLSIFLHKLEFPDIPKTIISDASEPGEGEHKITQYLKHNCQENNLKMYSIYGLDADLIMLSMVSGISSIHLLREAVHFGKVDKNTLLLLNIDLLKYHLYEDIYNKIGLIGQIQLSEQQIISDYIALCFMIGNDFIPNLPGLSIKNNGIEQLLCIYIDIIKQRKECLIYEGDLNIGFLKQIFISLSKLEDRYVTKERLQYERKKYMNRNNLKGIELELNKLQFLPLLKHKKLVYLINQGTKNWRTRYYYHLFTIKPKDHNNLLEITQNYLEGILWTTQYYFKECNDWKWNYSYLHAPSVQQLNEHFEVNYDTIKFNETIPDSPVFQLLYVLPPQSNHLLPKDKQYLMSSESPISYYYPIETSYCYYMNTYFHECEPKLPIIDGDEIEREL